MLKPDLFIILLKFDTNNFLFLFYEHFIKQIQFTDLIIRNYSQYSWILDVSSNNKYEAIIEDKLFVNDLSFVPKQKLDFIRISVLRHMNFIIVQNFNIKILS